MNDKNKNLKLEDDYETPDFLEIDNEDSDEYNEITLGNNQFEDISDVEENVEDLSYIEEIEDDEDDDGDKNVKENENQSVSTNKHSDLNALYRFNNNKHKREGRHSLKRDTIFKGKENKIETADDDTSDHPINKNYKIDSGSLFEQESRNNEEYVNQKNLSNDVFEILEKHTDLEFKNNRRKPNKQSFNDYYRLLLNHLSIKYTHSEIFVELAYYFSDNIFNIFKLLDKKYATIVIRELKSKGYLKNLDNINFV
jgi:vacuolar-type H+-ATPase subunit I/STV1